MNCSPPGSSVYGISQARVQKSVAISFSGDLPDPEIKLVFPALAGRFFTTEPPGKDGSIDTDYLYHFLEKAMTTHSSTLAWKILWTEEPGMLQSTRSQGGGHN